MRKGRYGRINHDPEDGQYMVENWTNGSACNVHEGEA